MIEQIPQTTFNVFEGKQTGSKALQLIHLSKAGFRVPFFKVIPSEFLERIIEESSAEDAIKRIEAFTFSEEQQSEIYRIFDQADFISVRSSAIGEDGKDHSFAGQYETFLNVDKDEVLDKIKEVWKSLFSKRIQSYKAQQNITGNIGMAVILQVMVDASRSGVMFGANPVSLDDKEMLISSVYGLGEGLVSGTLDSDNFYINNGEIRSEIAKKTQQLVRNGNGNTVFEEVANDKINIASLSHSELHELTTILSKLNEYYGFPQDVEWAYGDQLYILQSRPITNYKKREGSRIIWDNSNIIESYPGVSSPLTFSFIREMYKVVYIQFSALLGIRKRELEENMDVYENMLGHIRGRVYYNLRSWYRALALLPGYRINAEFMEGMMGVKEKFELEEKYSRGGRRLSDYGSILKTVILMISSFVKLPKSRRKFLRFLDKTIAEYKAIDFDQCHPEELMEHYHTFENVLTEKWNPPLVNDFFAMIFFGVFQKLVTKWVSTDHPHLHNDLLASSNDIISTQPMIQSLEIAKTILENDEYKLLFQEEPQVIWTQLEQGEFPELHQRIEAFLDRFGERCLGELKLETISYSQNPASYIHILRSYVENPSTIAALEQSKSSDLRKEAEVLVKKKLKGKPFKRWVFRYFMNKARDLVSNRENLRFERTRGFGIVRVIFSAMGKQFAQRGYIDRDRDIFYLTKEEIFDFILGTSVMTDLRKVIDNRKSTYEMYENEEFVPERITTYGVANDDIDFSKFQKPILDGDISGIACCPGIVEAEVCLVHSPDQIQDLQGKIMVASSTDPGWVSLFPSASGILVERGSLLSHSAIVARELGIPCIVAIDNVMSRLQSGDKVIMDGSTGIVKLQNDE